MSGTSRYQIAVHNELAWQQPPDMVNRLVDVFVGLDELAHHSRADAHMAEFFMSLADFAQACVARHCGLNCYPIERGNAVEDPAHLLRVLAKFAEHRRDGHGDEGYSHEGQAHGSNGHEGHRPEVNRPEVNGPEVSRHGGNGKPMNRSATGGSGAGI